MLGNMPHIDPGDSNYSTIPVPALMGAMRSKGHGNDSIVPRRKRMVGKETGPLCFELFISV